MKYAPSHLCVTGKQNFQYCQFIVETSADYLIRNVVYREEKNKQTEPRTGMQALEAELVHYVATTHATIAER